MSKPFTVVGVYEDNLQPFVFHVQAESADEAGIAAERQIGCEPGESDLLIGAVFDGHLMSHPLSDEYFVG